MRVDKAAVQFDEILVAIREESRTDMGHQNEIERVSLADFDQFLETGQIARVVIEVLCELVPDKNDCFQVVHLDRFFDPISQIVGGHGKSLDLTLASNFEDFLHQSVEGRISIAAQLFYDPINRITAKEVRIAAFHIDTEALLVFWVGEISDHRLLQRIRPLIFHSGERKGMVNAFLNGKDEILVSMNTGRAITVDSEHFPTVFDPLQTVAQGAIQVVLLKILLCLGLVCVEQLL